MHLTTIANLAAASSLLSLAHSRGVPVQERQIQYCGSLDEPTFPTHGDPEDGSGVWVTNNDKDASVKYFVIENSRDQHPWKYLDIPQGTRAFVQVCPTFQGRVARGTVAVGTDGVSHNVGTWVELSWAAGTVWGDVSFLKGADGGASLAATDGSGAARGCLAELLVGAPADALVRNDGGNMVVDSVVDKPGRAGGNQAARAWLNRQCDENQVYIQETNQAVISSNGRFEAVFSGGVA